MKRTSLLIAIMILPRIILAQESLSMEECRRLALDHNHKMKMAKNQVEAAEAVRKAAFTQYLPNFSINGAYSYINKDYQLLKNDLLLPVVPYTALDPATGQLNQAALNDPAVAASTFVINPTTGTPVKDGSGNPVFQKYTYLPASKSKIAIDNLYVINGGFTQPIYLGGKIRESNKIASYTKEIADHQLSLTEDEIIYSVEETYWRIVSLQEKVRLAQQYSEMLKRLVTDLTNIKAEGIITGNDLLKAKLKLSEADLMLLKAKNGMELSRMSLCQMTGIHYSGSMVLTDSLNNRDITFQSYLVNETEIEGRDELLMLEKSVQIAQAGEKLMLSRYLPNIVLNAGYTFMNPNPYRGLANEIGSDYNIGVVCNIPIFHFGDRKHTMTAAKSEHEAAVAKFDETKELLVLQLQQSVYRYNESAQKTLYAALALEQAKENLTYTKDNFSEGMLKTSDLLEAQVLWQKAYSELIDAQTEQQMSLSNLKRTTGKY